MTPHELSRQEEHLFAVLSGERFLKMEGLSNEVPFFIYPYEPEHALDVAKAKKRVKNRLASKGIEVREINLYDLSVDVLKERGDWDEVLEVEPELDKAEHRLKGSMRIGGFTLHPLVLLYALSGSLMISRLRIPKL